MKSLMPLFLFLSLLAMSAFANDDKVKDEFAFETESQAALFKTLNKELRCPKCQNQNIADSDAQVAKDLRASVYEQVMAGKNKDAIIDHMVDRYGYFVHYQPPITVATILLWLLPVVIVLLGFFVALRKPKNQSQTQWRDEDEQKLASLIAQYEEPKS